MWISLSVLLAVFGFGGYYAYSIYNSISHFQKKPGESLFPSFTPQLTGMSSTETPAPPPKWEGKERVNVLLMGGDSRGLAKNEVPRSDTLMVASIDPSTKKATLMSILRDTYVKIPGHGEDRINAAITMGGPDLAMRTVSNLLGIPIQYYVYTDFKGFIALVDAVGGIDIDVEKDMKYSDSEDDHIYDIDLKKGLQHLNGNTALQYVRFRHDATSDFTRTERQRKFLAAVADKLQSTTSLLKLPKILQSIDPYVETNLSVMDMLKLGSLAMDAKTSGMASAQIPPTNMLKEMNVGGASVLGADPDDLKQYVADLFAGTSDDSSDASTADNGAGTNNTTGTYGPYGTSGYGSPGASYTPTPTPRPTTKPSATKAPVATKKPTPKPLQTPKSPTESTYRLGAMGLPGGQTAPALQ
ncbi:LCP family protein [Paenibacillus cymbidii]|uniref:LCP family protein n=1 Tax=Paenibacillus cymbidii TaxID=1639034 RepID=UPI00108202D5